CHVQRDGRQRRRDRGAERRRRGGARGDRRRGRERERRTGRGPAEGPGQIRGQGARSTSGGPSRGWTPVEVGVTGLSELKSLYGVCNALWSACHGAVLHVRGYAA